MRDYLIFQFIKDKNSLKTELKVRTFKGEKKEWVFDEFETLFHYLPEINEFFLKYKWWIANQDKDNLYQILNEWYRVVNFKGISKILVRHKRLIIHPKLLEEMDILNKISEEEFIKRYNQRNSITFDIPFFLPEIREECLEILKESLEEGKSCERAIKEEHHRIIERILEKIKPLEKASSIKMENGSSNSSTQNETMKEKNPKTQDETTKKENSKNTINTIEKIKITSLDLVRESYIYLFRIIIKLLNEFPDFEKKFNIVSLLKEKTKNPTLLVLYKNLFRTFYRSYRIDLKTYDIYYPCFNPIVYKNEIDICQKELSFSSEDFFENIVKHSIRNKYTMSKKQKINLQAMVLFYLILKTIEMEENFLSIEKFTSLCKKIDLSFIFNEEEFLNLVKSLNNHFGIGNNNKKRDLIRQAFKYYMENLVVDKKELEKEEYNISYKTYREFKKSLFLKGIEYKELIEVWKDFIQGNDEDREIIKNIIEKIEAVKLKKIPFFP